MNNLGRGSENNQKEKDGIFTRETAGIVLVLFSVIALVVLISRRVIFGNVGFAISSFLLGTFGYCSYAVLAALIYGGVVLIVGKKRTAPRRRVALSVLLFLFLVALVHTITAAVGEIEYSSYGEYLKACYAAGENSFFRTTGGGVIMGLIVYPVVKLTTSVGGYIIFSLLLLGSAYLLFATETASKSVSRKEKAAPNAAVDYATSDTSNLYSLNYADTAQQGMQADGVQSSQIYGQTAPEVAQSAQIYAQPTENTAERSKRLYALGEEFDFKSKREMRQETRRQEEERRGRPQGQEAPLSPYAQSHNILYPESKTSDGDYSWYNERFGTGSSKSGKRSKASESAPYSSYTSNGIFDKDSYFNRRNRGAVSSEQYANNFSGSGSTKFSEGHELSTPRTPVPKVADETTIHTMPQASERVNKQEGAEKSAPTYSSFYADGAESNISYSERPKKIVTDTTRQSDAGSRPVEDFYRNDVRSVNASSGETQAYNSAAQPVSTDFRGGQQASNRGMDTSPIRPAYHVPEETRGQEISNNDAGSGKPSIDVSETVRRVGFGSIPTRRSQADPSASRTTQTQFPRPEDHPIITDVPHRTPRVETPPQEPEKQVEEASDRGSEGIVRGTESMRAERTEEPKTDRFSAETESVEEEQTGLKHISEDLDSAVNLFDEETPEESVVPSAIEQIRARREIKESGPQPRSRAAEIGAEAEQARPKHIYARYNAPSIDFLRDYPNIANEINTEEVEQNKITIVDTLAALKIPCEVEKVTRGPSVTRYDINIPRNIPTGRVLGCSNELAMRLHAKDGINVRINYESGLISIEIANEKKETVGLKDLLLSPEFMNAKTGSLAFGIGKDIEGRPICGDIVKMTHLLVAGATNSGKSVCLHSLIISLLYKYSPEELRIILVDPKQVEFNIYDKLPHLMINEIIYEPAKVVTMLNWAINEMERRYSLFKEKTRKGVLVREVNEYNANLASDEEMLPKIVIIIDELADLMAVAKKDVEDRIQRLTQKARAAGIHLILATQRPSVNVITGVIKSNLPTRIAFKVTQEVDSRTILDESGAENLLGQGDLLYRTATMTFPQRVQGAYVTNPEIAQVVDYIKSHNEAYFDDRVSDFINNEKGVAASGDASDEDSVESVYIDALRYVVSIGQASITMIQRRCSVGYPKAGKIIDWMENMGYISAFEGAKARKVLLTKEEFDSKYGDYGD